MMSAREANRTDDLSIIVYTCIANDYDVLMPLLHTSKDVRFICFTDNPRLKAEGWETWPLSSPAWLTEPRLINRYHKFFPNKVLPEVDCSIYVDGHIQISGDLREFAVEYHRDQVALVRIKHPLRNSVYQEAEQCKKRSLFSAEELSLLSSQLDFYREEGMPRDEPLSENGVLVRYHAAPELFDLMELWWEQVTRFTTRDQLSLPYCIWKYDVKTSLVSVWSLRKGSPYFRLRRHRELGLAGRIQAFSLRHQSFQWLYTGLLELRRKRRRLARRTKKVQEYGIRIFSS